MEKSPASKSEEFYQRFSRHINMLTVDERFAAILAKVDQSPIDLHSPIVSIKVDAPSEEQLAALECRVNSMAKKFDELRDEVEQMKIGLQSLSFDTSRIDTNIAVLRNDFVLPLWYQTQDDVGLAGSSAPQAAQPKQERGIMGLFQRGRKQEGVARIANQGIVSWRGEVGIYKRRADEIEESLRVAEKRAEFAFEDLIKRISSIEADLRLRSDQRLSTGSLVDRPDTDPSPQDPPSRFSVTPPSSPPRITFPPKSPRSGLLRPSLSISPAQDELDVQYVTLQVPVVDLD